MRLCVVVFNEISDLYGSCANKEVQRDFENTFKNGYDESCKDLPLFNITWFYKRSVGWFFYKGVSYVFIQAQLSAGELGRVEHCIYTLTGCRGDGNHISLLEFLGSPTTAMKKFLLRRM